MVYSLVGILVVIIIMLSIKIYLMEKSVREIMEAFADRLKTDTNILIDISSRDKNMRELADRINTELRLLRKERRCYQQGDQELKDSVTNISHDLRTPLTAICGYLNLLKHEEKSAAVDEYLAQVQNRVDVMISLTEEMFRYSIAASSYELKRERINVVSVLGESLLVRYAGKRYSASDSHARGTCLANVGCKCIKPYFFQYHKQCFKTFRRRFVC